MSNSLLDAFDFGPREMVSIVGGGGKTTLMFALARELVKSNRKVITGTTTKIFIPGSKNTPLLVLENGQEDLFMPVVHGLDTYGHVTIGKEIIPRVNKVQGCAPSLFNTLFAAGAADYILVEADGSRGRSVKAPREFEPVIPSCTSIVIGVIGLDVIGKPADELTVFCPSLFCEITGLKPGDCITERSLAALAGHADGLFKNAPHKACRTIFLNKLDLLNSITSIEAVASAFSHLFSHIRLAWGSLEPIPRTVSRSSLRDV